MSGVKTVNDQIEVLPLSPFQRRHSSASLSFDLSRQHAGQAIPVQRVQSPIREL